jgi:ABC-type Fe3+ transport system substrate-binding protein
MPRQLTGAGRILMVACGVALSVYTAHRYGLFERLRPKPSAPEAPSVRVRIGMLYGTEKERWLKAAVEEFARRRPEIGVDLKGLGTIDSVRAVAEGREKPVVWSPADEVALNLLDHEWQTVHGAPIVDRAEGVAPEPLMLTPLVMITWEDRARALSAAGKGDPTDWRVVHALATDPRGWLGLSAPAEWGFVKPGHTAPSASNSGLQTLILMAYGFHKKRAGLVPADILNPEFQQWMREIESAVGKFGTSSGTYMRDMVLYGPSKYDLVWNYESVAISDMTAAQGRWGNLAVFYPKPTLWSNHPFAVLKADWVTAEQRAAALELRTYLLSAEVQARALESGFRPANPDVKLVTTDPQSPWNRLKPFGVRLDVPAVAESPSGEVTRLLLETWRRVVESR